MNGCAEASFPRHAAVLWSHRELEHRPRNTNTTTTTTTTNTRPWATAAPHAGPATALPYFLTLAILTHFPFKSHSHRSHIPLRSHGRPPQAGGAAGQQRKPLYEHRRHTEGDRSADCSSSEDCGWQVPSICAVRTWLIITRADPKSAPLTLAKLQDPFKKTLESAQKDLKPVYAGLNKYGKELDKVPSHSRAFLYIN
jgi:hypothetical protein